MAAFGFIIPLIFLSLPIFGLFVIVKKETMETQQDMSPGEKMAEKNQPAFHLFLYLASFFSLGFLMSGVISIYFQFINKYVKDVALMVQFDANFFDDAAVKYGIASLLIAAIVYFPISYLINQKVSKGEIRSDSLVRKFLTYVALFILVAITIGSLAVLLFDYLNGELTGNAFGKIAAFFLTALFFAGFYFWEIRRKEFLQKPFQMFFGAALAVAMSGLIVGFAIADSPTVTRENKIDMNVISEMQSMKMNIEDLYNNNGKLPEKNEIKSSARFKIDYIVNNAEEYQICSEFLQNQDKKDFYQKDWNHPVGRYCFTFNINARENLNSTAPIKAGVPVEVTN